MVNSSDANPGEPGRSHGRLQRDHKRVPPGGRSAASCWLAWAISGCGPSIEAPSLVTFVAERPLHREAPTATPAPPCVIEGDGSSGYQSFLVFASAGDPSPIAVVRDPRKVPVRFTAFPPYETGGRVAVEIAEKQTLEMRGFVDLDRVSFQLARRVDFVAPHVFADAGTVVQVRGRDGTELLVDVRTAFEEPKSVSVRAPCSALAYANASLADRHPEAGREVVPAAGEMTFYAGPGLGAIFQARLPIERTFTVFERRGDFVHVRVGHRPSYEHTDGTLVVDAWVRHDSIAPPTPDDSDHSDCGLPDERDRCADGPRIREDTPIRLGSTGPVIGTARSGAWVTLGDRADGGVAVEFFYDVIGPPPGKKFFVEESALVGCHEWSGPEDEEACPCPEP